MISFQICVARLLNENDVALDTIKMQVYFDMNYTSRNDFLEEHRRVLEMRLQPIVREITDSRARTKEELESKPFLIDNYKKHDYVSHQLNGRRPLVFLV